MGFLDRLLGRLTGHGQPHQQGGYQPGYQQSGSQQPYPAPYPQDRARGGQRPAAPGMSAEMGSRPDAARSQDEQAIRRYQYLLQTAPPDKIEQAHAEAFAQLTPQQRQHVLQQLAGVDPSERPADDSPRSLARAATRMEMRRPGTLFGTFGGPGYGRAGMGGGMGRGMGMGSVLLPTLAGAFIGTAIANEMFDDDGFMDWDTGGDPGEQGEGFADGGGYAGDGGGYQGEPAGYDGGGYDDGGFGGDIGGFDGGGFGGDF